jgi:GMP synthase-like glutamine amidotransferase
MGAFARMMSVDGIILSGSEKNTTDSRDPWVIEYLEGLKDLLNLRGDDPLGPSVPVLGICYGHQAIACAMGGETARFRKRADIVKVRALSQAHHHAVFRPLLNDTRELAVVVTHSDQVVRMPRNFYATLTSDYCDIQGRAHDLWPIVTVQAHPEATTQMLDDPREAPDWTHVAPAALSSHAGPEILARFADWVAGR